MDFSLAVGVLVSLVVEVIKRKFGTNTQLTYAAFAVVAVVGAAAYTLLKDTAFWPVLVQIVLASQTFYALLLKNLPRAEA